MDLITVLRMTKWFPSARQMEVYHRFSRNTSIFRAWERFFHAFFLAQAFKSCYADLIMTKEAHSADDLHPLPPPLRG